MGIARSFRKIWLNGIAKEIFAADQAKSLAETIGKHSPAINAKDFGALFGSLQNILSDHQTLAVAKIYDPIAKRNPTRSIPATLSFIEKYSHLWTLPERFILEEFLVSAGAADSTNAAKMNNQELSVMMVNFFNMTVPGVHKSDHCALSSALNNVRDARNKVHAHNEAIEKAVRKLPTWGEVESLVNFAKEFICVIGRGFLGIHFGNSSNDYLLTWDAQRISRTMDKIIKKAVLGID